MGRFPVQVAISKSRFISKAPHHPGTSAFAVQISAILPNCRTTMKTQMEFPSHGLRVG